MDNVIKRSLIESNFGEIQYNVGFDKIICEKVCFPEFDGMIRDPVASIKDVRSHGVAIAVAENIKQQMWVLTTEGFLVRCSKVEKVGTLMVNILIDENVDVLSSYNYVLSAKQTMKVVIRGFDVEIEVEAGVRPGMWCVFL